VTRRIDLEEGVRTFTLPVRIPEPNLWWPNGLGQPFLYTAHVILDAGRRSDTVATRLGLREIELVTEADSLGESFFFRINGLPVFMKGANVIPLDHFSPRVAEEDYEALFRDVTGANMNMLRVWGGGIYEEDRFYDLADERGILIWQDFMFANGMYPGDSLFLANVRAEARDQVRRLRNHPSLALWCGNNEMDEAWRNWGWARAYESPQDSAAVRRAYEAIFHGILPDVVAEEDGTRRYWPSSPSLGWGDPESLNRGDSHYWGIWHGREPFQVYQEKLPRFSSEFGFQAFPPMATVEAFTEPADRQLSDPTLLVHQKHPIGNELMAEYMARDYPVPTGFEDFAYVSQLLQARGIRTALEAHRRAKPRTMGSLYWQLNDTWPAISWSSRDYFGRWKALHYTAREAFSPLLFSMAVRGDTLDLWGVSDLPGPVTGTLFLELMDFQGTSLWQSPLDLRLDPMESRVLWSRTMEELLGGADPKQVVLVAVMGEGGTAQAEGESPSPPMARFYFERPKDLTLRVPAIHMDLARDGEEVVLTLTTGTLARDVLLTLPGVHFPDNFFDLLPNRPRTVRFFSELGLEEVERALRIKTLADVPREGMEVSNDPNRSLPL
jgi:beta-mannosidase